MNSYIIQTVDVGITKDGRQVKIEARRHSHIKDDYQITMVVGNVLVTDCTYVSKQMLEKMLESLVTIGKIIVKEGLHQ